MDDDAPQAPRDFCEACLREATGRNPGSIWWHFAGFGLLFFGKSEKCPTCGSVVRILCLVLFFIPVFPLKTYRYLQIDGHSLRGRFIARRTHTRSKTLVALWRLAAVSGLVFLPALGAMRQPTPGVPTGSLAISQPPSPAGAPPGGLAAAGPWEYHSQEHGFSLTLPSSDWARSDSASAIARFSSHGWEVAVLSVKPQTDDDLRATIPILQVDLETMLEPEFQETKTDAGNDYLLSAFLRPSPSYSQGAECRAWLKRSEITVRLEIRGDAQRTTPQKFAEFKQLAKAICLSVK